MDIKVNASTPITQPEIAKPVQETDASFKFTLMSRIGEEVLHERLTAMMEEITRQGDKLAKRRDIKDMKRKFPR